MRLLLAIVFLHIVAIAVGLILEPFAEPVSIALLIGAPVWFMVWFARWSK